MKRVPVMLRKSYVAQPFRAAPAAVGRPEGLRYIWPPAFSQPTIACLILLVLPVVALAQSVGTLRVTVVDPSGAVIVGAQVDVRPSTPAGAAGGSLQTGARGDLSLIHI